MDLTEAIDGYLLFKATRATEATIKTDRVIFRQFLTWLSSHFDGSVLVADIESVHIRDYIEHHKGRGLSPSTLHRHYAALGALWTWLSSPEIQLASRHVVKVVPVPRIPKRIIKTLTHAEIQRLLIATAQMLTPRRGKALILFLLDSGARVSELSQVQLPQLDLKTGRVLVTGKGAKQRYVYIGQRALQAVWLYIKQERPESAKWKP